MRCFEATSRPPDAFGYEHEVWFAPAGEQNGRVVKATYGNCFGHLPDGTEATPLGYLERLRLCNEEFGDQIRLLGVEESRPGVIRVITSQPAVEGHPAGADEVMHFFTAAGFEKRLWGENTVWYRPLDGLVASDTHGGNVLRTSSGALVAIDVPLMRWTAGMHALEPVEAVRAAL